MKYACMICALAMLVVACNSNQGNELENRYKKVMAIHDEVMPRMGEIQVLKKQLSDYSANVLDGKIEDSSDVFKTIGELQSELDRADELMMEWMHKFDQNWHKKEEKAALSYLNQEEKRIIEVKKAMEESIRDAQAFLTEKQNSDE